MGREDHRREGPMRRTNFEGTLRVGNHGGREKEGLWEDRRNCGVTGGPWECWKESWRKGRRWGDRRDHVGGPGLGRIMGRREHGGGWTLGGTQWVGGQSRGGGTVGEEEELWKGRRDRGGDEGPCGGGTVGRQRQGPRGEVILWGARGSVEVVGGTAGARRTMGVGKNPGEEGGAVGVEGEWHTRRCVGGAGGTMEE